MDKNNKYYGIIENLVRNHRKFLGLEAILDDIIDDVYNHSKSIIGTIKDDNVIEGYLNKVVSTSIITVPKKMNYQNVHRQHIPSEYESVKAKIDAELKYEIKPKEQKTDNAAQVNVLTADVKELSNVKTEEQHEDLIDDSELENILTEENIISGQGEVDYEELEIESEKPNTEFVDKMINSITEDTLKENGLSEEEIDDDDAVSEDVVGIEDSADNSLDGFLEDETENVVEIADEQLIQEDNIKEEELVSYSDVSDIENLSELNVEEKTETETETEKLILTDDTTELDADSYSEPETFSAEENDDILSAEEDFIIESPNEVDTEELEVIEPETGKIELSQKTGFSDDSSNFEDVEMLELENTESEQEKIDLSDDGLFENEVEDSLLMQENNDAPVLIDGLQDDIEELGSQETFDLSGEDSETILELNEDDSIEPFEDNTESDLVVFEDNKEDDISENKEFKPADYSAFDYSPQEKETKYDSGEIVSKLLDVEQQEPDLNILKIFDLKYKQNLTIEEIMAELNLDKQEVIAALDKMVDLI